MTAFQKDENSTSEMIEGFHRIVPVLLSVWLQIVTLCLDGVRNTTVTSQWTLWPLMIIVFLKKDYDLLSFLL